MILNENIIGVPIIEDVKKSKLPEGVLTRLTYNVCNIGQLNQNNRVYEREVWDKVLADEGLQEKLANRTLYGQGEHPEATTSDLQLTSHIITDMWIDESENRVYQKMEILDTPTGRILETLLRAGCQVGVSTRAEGDLEDYEIEEGEGKEPKQCQRVLPDSYHFQTTDFTADPSTRDTVPLNVESKLLTTVGKLAKEGKMTLYEKKFACNILESIKCKEYKCGDACKVVKMVEELEDPGFEVAVGGIKVNSEDMKNKNVAIQRFLSKASEEDINSLYWSFVYIGTQFGGKGEEADKLEAIQKYLSGAPEEEIETIWGALLGHGIGESKLKEDQTINVYKTADGSKTDIQEEDVELRKGVLVDKEFGLSVVLDKEASGSAIDKETDESKLAEGVSELVGETPGIGRSEQEILNWALKNKVVSNDWPEDEDMIHELAKTDVDIEGAGPEDSDSLGLGEIQANYLKYILLPKAKAAYTESEKETTKEVPGGEELVGDDRELEDTLSGRTSWEAEAEKAGVLPEIVEYIADSFSSEDERWDEFVLEILATPKYKRWFENEFQGNEFDLQNELEELVGMKRDEEGKDSVDLNTDEDVGKGNPPPSEDSNWYRLATNFDIGVLDLNDFAGRMGFDDFDDLDASISPNSLYDRDPEKFVTALKSSSQEAANMNGFELEGLIESINEITLPVEGEVDPKVMKGNMLKDPEGNVFVVAAVEADSITIDPVDVGVSTSRPMSWEDAKEKGLVKIGESFGDVDEDVDVEAPSKAFLKKLVVTLQRMEREGYKLTDDDKEIIRKAPQELLKRSKYESKTPNDIMNQITDLRVAEACAKADFEVCKEHLLESRDASLATKIVRSKLTETAKQLSEMSVGASHDLESKENESLAIRGVLERKAKQLVESKGLLEKANNLLAEADVVEASYKLSITEHQDELIKTSTDAIKEGRKEVIEEYFEDQVKSHRMEVDENSQALLEDCQNLQDVDSLMEKLIGVARRSALHSKPLTEVKIQQASVDPIQDKVDKMMGPILDRLGG